MRENYEYGVILYERDVVKNIARDLIAYFNLGNIFERSSIESLIASVREIRELKKRLDNTVEAKRLREALAKSENTLKEKILSNRVREGRSINAILSETILHLLRSKGPLSTPELHSFIKGIHPDICDDTIDRVINGQHFGKKWKHAVRSAQQHLKRTGKIDWMEGKWFVTD